MYLHTFMLYNQIEYPVPLSDDDIKTQLMINVLKCQLTFLSGPSIFKLELTTQSDVFGQLKNIKQSQQHI